MNCLTRETLFDYINKESNKNDVGSIKRHLESCEQCLESYHQVYQQIQRVRAGLDLLMPENIPDPSYYLPQETRKASRRGILEEFRKQLKLSSGFGWKTAAVLALLIIVLISASLFRKDSEAGRMEMQQYLMAADTYFEADPKADWNERNLVITIFDKEKNTLEYVETTMDGSKTESVKLRIGEDAF